MTFENNSQLNINNLIQSEVNRISQKYNKDFLDCEDLIKITGLGRDNVRNLMRSKNFPTTNGYEKDENSKINAVMLGGNSMKETIKVVLDAMGGDNAPKEIIKGASLQKSLQYRICSSAVFYSCPKV